MELIKEISSGVRVVDKNASRIVLEDPGGYTIRIPHTIENRRMIGLKKGLVKKATIVLKAEAEKYSTEHFTFTDSTCESKVLIVALPKEE